MKFAKVVFTVAGILGLIEIVPMYFLFDMVGQRTPPPINHPEFYYGFAGVALAWQLAFLVIGRDPVRYRMLMPCAIVEKATYAAAIFALCAQHRVAASMAAPACIDIVLCVLFVTAFFKTKASV